MVYCYNPVAVCISLVLWRALIGILFCPCTPVVSHTCTMIRAVDSVMLVAAMYLLLIMISYITASCVEFAYLCLKYYYSTPLILFSVLDCVVFTIIIYYCYNRFIGNRVLIQVRVKLGSWFCPAGVYPPLSLIEEHAPRPPPPLRITGWQ